MTDCGACQLAAFGFIAVLLICLTVLVATDHYLVAFVPGALLFAAIQTPNSFSCKKECRKYESTPGREDEHG